MFTNFFPKAVWLRASKISKVESFFIFRMKVCQVLPTRYKIEMIWSFVTCFSKKISQISLHMNINLCCRCSVFGDNAESCRRWSQKAKVKVWNSVTVLLTVRQRKNILWKFYLLKTNHWIWISTCIRVFPRRLTHGGIFNSRLLFENNRLLFSLLFSGNFFGGQGLDGGE